MIAFHTYHNVSKLMFTAVMKKLIQRLKTNLSIKVHELLKSLSCFLNDFFYIILDL